MRGLPGRVVGGVARTQPQRDRGCRDREHEHGGAQRDDAGVVADELAPAQPRPPTERLAAARARAVQAAGARLGLRGLLGAALAPAPVGNFGAGHRQQRGQERQRGEHHEQHPDRCRDRDAVEEVDPEQHHAEQRDHHRRPGEQDGAPGGVDRAQDGLAHVVERRSRRTERLAEAGEDEQRVVDADAEADHRRELGGEVGRVDNVREEGDQAETGAEAEQRRDDRQPHRDHRAERDQQHDNRCEQADGRGDPEAGLLGLLDGLPAELDVQPGPRGRFRGVHDSFGGALGKQVRFFVEDDRREGDPAVRGDRATRGGAAVRADHLRDVRLLGDFREHRFHVLAHRRVVDGAVVDLEDDGVAIPGLGAEAVPQQVGGALGVRVGQREVVRVARPCRLREHVDEQQQHYPTDHYVLAVRR